jgi:hypothetical protein
VTPLDPMIVRKLFGFWEELLGLCKFWLALKNPGLE